MAVIEPADHPEPQPRSQPIEEEKPEAAAKEEIPEPAPEPVLPLVAEGRTSSILADTAPSALLAPVHRRARRSQGRRNHPSRRATAAIVCAGLAKNMSYELLKVNVLVIGQRITRGESGFHVDTLRSVLGAAAHGVSSSKPAKSWA